jgi:uncharacterized protein
MLNRRTFMKWLGHLVVAGASVSTYAFAIEPGFRLRTVTYAFTPPRWTPGLKLKIVMLADPHLVEPHMPVSRWDKIIAEANAMEPDVILLMGDFISGTKFRTRKLKFDDAVNSARACRAKLGTYAVCGNHDWWEDRDLQVRGTGLPLVVPLLEAAGIPVLENRAMRLEKNGLPFWLTGTSSIVAIWRGHGQFEDRSDLAGTLAQVTDDSPIIHLAHEPDLFVDVPERVSLTLSGHTHGGQVRILGFSPIVPSSFGNRFAYGHIIENNRHLVVSGGLGCSVIPVRLGSPPEITVLELG